jgi:hypothetical protein
MNAATKKPVVQSTHRENKIIVPANRNFLIGKGL